MIEPFQAILSGGSFTLLALETTNYFHIKQALNAEPMSSIEKTEIRN